MSAPVHSVPLRRAVRDSVRYGFAIGKVRVLETRIFGAGTYERLVDAPTFAEQKRVLSDTVYGRYLEGATNADDVEVGLEAALDDFYRFLDESSLPEPVVRF
ncbi:MAG: V-type ATPase subunit, partial [Actinomycetia bacterium]|nr:V-type ATPase subunit [Actinomycetes bacterium]